MFYSGPSNLEKNAWKTHIGTPREVAMYHWVHFVKSIVDKIPSADEMARICKEDNRLRDKPSAK